MKIAFSNIQNTNTIKASVRPIFLREKTGIQIPAFKSISSDTFINNTNIYERALAKINDFTKEEYDSLTEEEKTVLRESIEGKSNISLSLINADEDVKIHQYAAEAIRHVLDEQYGKDNYVVIAIGRSLSSISKLLEMKIGKENAKNIPMSAMDRFYLHTNNLDCYQKNIDRFCSLDGFDKFKRYLDSIGLSKEKVDNSGKNYVIMDFTASGMSLKAAYTILTSDKLLGNEKRNITTASMRDIISTIELDNTPLGSLDEKLCKSSYKKYSTLERMKNYNDIEYMTDYRASENNTVNKNNIKQIKLFGFALLDSEYSDTEKPDGKIKLKERKLEKNKNIWLTPYAQYQNDVEEDSQFLYQLQSRIEKSLKSLQEAEVKYPLEYKNYNNQKELEKNNFYESSIVQLNAAVKLKKANRLLSLMSKDIKIFMKEHETHPNKSLQEEYYKNFRPSFLRLLNVVSEKFTQEYCEKFCDNIDAY